MRIKNVCTPQVSEKGKNGDECHGVRSLMVADLPNQ